MTSIVWPLAVVIVSVSPSTDSTVPVDRQPGAGAAAEAAAAAEARLPARAAGRSCRSRRRRRRPVRAGRAETGAVLRPTANATPPMATAAATARTRLSQRPPEPFGLAAGATGGVASVGGDAGTGPVGPTRRSAAWGWPARAGPG